MGQFGAYMMPSDSFICSGCNTTVRLYPVEGRPGHFLSSHQCPPLPTVIQASWVEIVDIDEPRPATATPPPEDK